MKKITILHTIETAGPGGAETVVLNLASRLDKQRFRSIALLPREDWLSERLRECGVLTIIVNSKRWYDPRLPLAMARLIRREHVDLVHSHLPGQNFYSCAVGRLVRCKVIATYHGAIELTQTKGLRGAIQIGWVQRSADAVVVVCDYVGAMLRDIGFPAAKIVRIYNGIDVDRFQIRGDGRLKGQLGLSNGTKIVGTVANLRQSKGYQFLVEAARKVIDTNPDVCFVAVGDLDPVLAKPVKELIARLDLQNHFVLLGFRKDVPELLSEFDIFVLPSVSEGFPLVALEAMASARPSVLTRSGGPQEIVDDGLTGYLVPPADSTALAEGICALLRDPQRSAAFARDSRARVETAFTTKKMIQQYEQLYERLIGGDNE